MHSEPRLAVTDEEIASCYETMHSLRTDLKEEEFVPTVRNMMREGYQLAYIAAEKKVLAVAGYRVSTNLAMGKNLYLDDLATNEGVRSKGLGAVLLDWLDERCKEHDCNLVHLDSGVQRELAHRFYFRHGFTIAAFHFVRERART